MILQAHRQTHGSWSRWVVLVPLTLFACYTLDDHSQRRDGDRDASGGRGEAVVEESRKTGFEGFDRLSKAVI